MRKFQRLVMGVLLAVLAATPGISAASLPALPPDCQQVILVTSDSWDTKLGVLRLYERVDGRWRPTGAEWHVDLGRNGLGGGRGLRSFAGRPGPEKREGDGRAPAGVFDLGPAFGYDSEAPAGTRLPYRQATDRDYFVDDVRSTEYNQWVRLPEAANDPETRWQSFERLRRPDGKYRLGLVVHHNMGPAVTGKGSAIFLHVWGESSTGTAGCTAMEERHMRVLLAWLDPAKRPLLVQLPRAELKAFLQDPEQALVPGRHRLAAYPVDSVPQELPAMRVR